MEEIGLSILKRSLRSPSIVFSSPFPASFVISLFAFLGEIETGLFMHNTLL